MVERLPTINHLPETVIGRRVSQLVWINRIEIRCVRGMNDLRLERRLLAAQIFCEIHQLEEGM